MRFNRIRLQNFRNCAFTDLALGNNRIFLLGLNGQGKSNLLEALGLVSALRSFRTHAPDALPRKGHPEYCLFAEVEHPSYGLSHVTIRGGKKGRFVQVDEQKVTKMADFIGRFPVVVMSSEDIHLLRGAPSERRRCFDLIFSAGNQVYYSVLQRYHKVLANRNRLLKQAAHATVLDAFEMEMAPLAQELTALRAAGIQSLAQKLLEAYVKIAGVADAPKLVYAPNCGSSPTVEDCLGILRAARSRDQILGSTTRGPHRDDFKFNLQELNARDYASDGQQRALCIALRMAQARYLEQAMLCTPVLLADDVLGELDAERSANFWSACPTNAQVIATGTEPPEDGEAWHVVTIKAGTVCVEDA